MAVSTSGCSHESHACKAIIAIAKAKATGLKATTRFPFTTLADTPKAPRLLPPPVTALTLPAQASEFAMPAETCCVSNVYV